MQGGRGRHLSEKRQVFIQLKETGNPGLGTKSTSWLGFPKSPGL